MNLVNLNIATVNNQRESKRPNPHDVQNPPHTDKEN